MATVTATRTSRKPRPKPARHVTIGAPTNGVFALHITIGEGEKAQHFGYYVQPLAADFGLGFRFTKFGTEQEDGEPNEYDVLIDTHHGPHSCECKGFQRWNHCKHLEGLLALIQSGKITVPTAKPQPTKEQPLSADYAALLAMKPGNVRTINGHRVERVACGWMIDEAFASSPRQLAAYLQQSEPCCRPPVPDDVFEDL